MEGFVMTEHSVNRAYLFEGRGNLRTRPSSLQVGEL